MMELKLRNKLFICLLVSNHAEECFVNSLDNIDVAKCVVFVSQNLNQLRIMIVLGKVDLRICLEHDR